MTRARLSCAAVLLLAVTTPWRLAVPALQSGAAVRDTLRRADQRVSGQVYAGGLAGALPAAMASDATLLLEGAPLVQGREAIDRLLRAQTALMELRASWTPFRVLVSRDGSLGATFGESILQRKDAPPESGRYLTVWRRNPAGGWEIVAQAHTGLLGPGQTVLPAPGPGSTPGSAPPANPFADADLAFARLAADSGAPAAFARYIAPDGMTFAGTGELNIGPAAARARLAEGRAGTAHWQWHPVVSFVAASGDLGATIGEAEIRVGSGAEAETFYSKYLTIWQRQPDGSLKFVVDGGSARPRP